MATATSISTYQMLIGGEWVDAASGDTYESMNPYTGQTWATMPDAQAEDVDRAVQAARKAVKDPAWRRMVPAQRAALLRSLADLVAADERLGSEAATLLAPGAAVRRRTTPGGAGPVPVAEQRQRFADRLADQATRIGG